MATGEGIGDTKEGSIKVVPTLFKMDIGSL